MRLNKKLLLVLAILSTQFSSVLAQCDTASAIGTPTIIAASCPGNGQVTVSSVSPALTLPEYYQYSLFDTLGAVVKPYQDTNYFSSVNAGVYDIRVRRVCLLGISAEKSLRITVSSTYVPASITSTNIQHRVLCNDGRFQVNASGSAPLQYALVTSLAAPDIPSSYVVPKRSTNVFDSLAAGTHYVRVFDACNGFVTNSLNIPTRPGPSINSVFMSRYGCDSFGFLFTVTNHYQIAGTNDTDIRAWVIFPDGTTDSVKMTNTAVASTAGYGTSFPLTHISSLDPAYNPALTYPDNITAWPVKIIYGYRDACGNIYTDSVSYNKPTAITLDVRYDEYSTLSTCDSVAAYFRVSTTGPLPQLSYHYLISDMYYSIDAGSTWQPVVTSSAYFVNSLTFQVPRSTLNEYRLAICGDTLIQTETSPALPALTSTLYADNREACPGNSGISIRTLNRNGPLTVEMLSAPIGQALVPVFTIAGNTDVYLEPIAQLRNLLPGTYQILLTDSTGVDCPRNVTRTITIGAIDSINYSIEYTCGGGWLLSSDSRYYSRSNLTPLAGRLKVKVFDSAGVQVLGGVLGYSGVQESTSPPLTTVTLSPASIATLAVGTYTVLAYRLNADSCSYAWSTFDKPGSLISLDKSKFIAGCSGGTASIVGYAESPFPPYLYTLYRGAISPDSILVASTSSNIFNALTLGPTYYLQVLDSCGNSITREMSIAETNIPISIGSGFMPCPGDNFTASVYEMPGVTYQWYKDSVAIVGATTNTLDIVSFSASDSGVYKVELTAGTCVVFSRTLRLNPADCGMVLPLGLLSFDARRYGQSVRLAWSVAANHTNSHFVVLRSNDGRNWETLSRIAATEESLYTYTDNKPKTGLNMYRLQLLDKENQSNYSETKKVYIDDLHMPSVNVFPNPATNSLFVELHDNETASTYEITDIVGRVLQQGVIRDNMTNTINLAELHTGLYLLKMQLQNKTYVQQISIQK